jgi:hypothetical protein
MDFDIFYKKLLDYYNVNSLTSLSQKISIERTTLSGWKSRKALGTMLDHINSLDPTIISKIYNDPTIINNLQNSKISGDGINNSKCNTYNTNSKERLTPSYLLDDLDNTFSRCKNEEQKQNLIDSFDDFILGEKKKLR